MRIIGGTLRGRILRLPKDLPVRPTTDFAKTGLFNFLSARLDFEGLTVLDLFSGTGHISMEFASRGASKVIAVDKHFKCALFLKTMAEQFDLPISVNKKDVFEFLGSAAQSFDLIFADPPYDLPNIEEIHSTVFKRSLLKKEGMLIIEHGPRTSFSHLPGFEQHRKYGNVNFSFFRNT